MVSPCLTVSALRRTAYQGNSTETKTLPFAMQHFTDTVGGVLLQAVFFRFLRNKPSGPWARYYQSNVAAVLNGSFIASLRNGATARRTEQKAGN